MNRKKIKFSIIAVFLFLLCFFLFANTIPAGDWIDPGGDLGGDWGNNNNDGGSGSFDWGDSGGSGGGVWIIGGDGDSSLGGAIFIIIVIVIILIVAAAVRKGNSGGNYGGGSSYSSSSIQMSDTWSINQGSLTKLKESDPEFSESSMLSKAENLFTTMQLAWCKQDYEPVRPFLSNALFEQQLKQLKDKILRDEKNVSSEIAVLQSKLESWSSDGHTEYLNIWLRIKMKDHIVRRSDPSQIVSGNPGRMYYLDFRWQFTRSAGAKTNAQTDAVKTGECPNCGANININQSGKCEYCGSVISTTEYDWVLSKIDGLQQRSR